MTALNLQNCQTLEESISALSREQASRYMQQLEPNWQLDTEQQNISHTYKFKNYYQTIAFVNIIAQIAHQQDHHPDLKISYNQCTVTYNTHSVGGLSLYDFICAAKINAAQTL